MKKNRTFYGLVVVSLFVLLAFSFYQHLSANKEEYAQLSHFDLLDTADVQFSAKQSVLNDDPGILNQQLETVIEVAKAMPLRPESIDFLGSTQAVDYATFHAKRAIFDDELILRFNTLDGIEDLKKAYPEAKDKFSDADKMIIKRNEMFKNIQQTLLDQGLDIKTAEDTARQLWEEKFQR